MGFVEYLEEAASKGELVNLVFEERLLNLVSILQKIAGPFAAADIPYEVVDGLAVLIHVEQADPTHSVLTRDVDIMISRSDLDRAVVYRRISGLSIPACCRRGYALVWRQSRQRDSSFVQRREGQGCASYSSSARSARA